MFYHDRHYDKLTNGFLALIDDGEKELSARQVPIVCEYEDVFQKIPGLPPKREINFSIDLIPGTSPISIAPYRMAPKEMQELKR